MPHATDARSALLAQIDDLVEESCKLPRTRESWARHVEIQAQIIQLCRRFSDLNTSTEQPYWEAPLPATGS